MGVFRTHADAPRVLIANSNLVPRWATWEHFSELDRKGLMMYGQMTAGSWIYIGSQGIVQGTYETFAEMGRKHYGGDWSGKWILTAGLGGMGGAQPLAAVMAGACCLAIECQSDRIEKRLQDRLAGGMIEEVAGLRRRGVSDLRLEKLGLEYRYITRYLRGDLGSLADLKLQLEIAIRQLAKDQLTWFKRDRRIIWLDTTKDYFQEACERIQAWRGV